MRGRDACAQILTDGDDLFHWKASNATQESREILAVDKLHRKEDLTLGLSDVKDAAHGGVGNLTREARLVDDALPPFFGIFMNQLQRHRGLQYEVLRLPHFGHPPLANPRDDAVAAGEQVAR